MSEQDKLRLQQIREQEAERQAMYLQKQREETDPIGDILWANCIKPQTTPKINLDKAPVRLEKPLKENYTDDNKYKADYAIWWRLNNPDKLAKYQSKKQIKYQENPEKYRKASRDSYGRHKEKVIARTTKYKKAHPEKCKQYMAEYRKNNPEKFKKYSEKNKIKKLHTI